MKAHRGCFLGGSRTSNSVQRSRCYRLCAFSRTHRTWCGKDSVSATCLGFCFCLAAVSIPAASNRHNPPLPISSALTKWIRHTVGIKIGFLGPQKDQIAGRARPALTRHEAPAITTSPPSDVPAWTLTPRVRGAQPGRAPRGPSAPRGHRPRCPAWTRGKCSPCPVGVPSGAGPPTWGTRVSRGAGHVECLRVQACLLGPWSPHARRAGKAGPGSARPSGLTCWGALTARRSWQHRAQIDRSCGIALLQ